MPCFFCIAAVTVATTVLVPALVDRTEESMRTAADDLRRVKDTSTMTMWTGTFRFEIASGAQRTAATTVTLYKESRRVRIQCMTHRLPHADMHALQESVAALISAQVMSRTDGDPALLTPDSPRGESGAVGTRIPASRPSVEERQPRPGS